MATLVRSLIFSLLIPVTVAVLIPRYLLPHYYINCGIWSFRISLVIMAFAVFVYLWCVLAFVVQGKGTPAVWFTHKLSFLLGEEPKKAVTGGLYKLSRNPMYLSVCLFIIGLAYFEENLYIFIYALVVFAFFHWVVVKLEEPHLKKKFGEEYLSYMKKSRRWL